MAVGVGMFVNWDLDVLEPDGADEYRLQIERGEHAHIKNASASCMNMSSIICK